MEQLLLTNTLSRKKELFRSWEPGKVKIFTCGPSVYSRSHLGNYRTFLFEDVLQRHLEHIGYRVERLINLTDVEDKGIEEAQAKGVTLRELTAPVEELFFREVRLLGITLPGYIPRSSTSVDQAVKVIKILTDRGYAYFHDKNLGGFANWMTVQNQEETFHAMKFFRYVAERGGRVTLEAIDKPQFEWASPLAAMEAAQKHEAYITGRINDLMNLAIKEKDHASANLLNWFVAEQVEEEDSVNEVVQKLRLLGSDGGGLFMMDRDMATRVFTPPVE